MRALLENKFCACNAENYREPTVTDRFPFEMLEFYCAALGIRLFDPDFLGECFVFHRRNSRSGRGRPGGEARSRLRL